MPAIKIRCPNKACGHEHFIEIPLALDSRTIRGVAAAVPANDNEPAGMIWMSSTYTLNKSGRPQAIAKHMARFGKTRSEIGRGMQDRINAHHEAGGLILNVDGTVHIPAKNDVKLTFGATWHYISAMLAFAPKDDLAQDLTKSTLPCWRIADLCCRLDGAKFE